MPKQTEFETDDNKNGRYVRIKVVDWLETLKYCIFNNIPVYNLICEVHMDK